jgi:hypothetical protein
LAANSCTLYLALWEGSSNASAPPRSPECDVNLRWSASTDVSPVNPVIDEHNRTGDLAVELALSVFGKKIV